MALHVEDPARLQAVDYHAQYDQSAFLESLRATRRRQASAIIQLLRERAGSLEQLLDFGAGRGWFLQECRDAGVKRCAGVDTSELAVTGLRSIGIEAAIIEPPRQGNWDLELNRLSFAPRVLTLLDVVEHFPASAAPDLLRRVVEQAGPQLEWVVMKVPISHGLLYRIAAGLSRLGVHGPLEQLYQCGTHPPHFNYFSRRSAQRILERSGLQVVAQVGDADYEPDELASRVSALRRLPRGLGGLAGRTAAGISRLFGIEDSIIFVARPVHPRGG